MNATTDLLREQRRKVIELTREFIHHRQERGFFGNSFTWLLACAHNATAARGCVLPRKT